MTKSNKVPASDDAWESQALGADGNHVEAAPAGASRKLDDMLDLQLISVRLPKALIDDLKFIGEREGMKYQPLMRKVLARFVDCEMKAIARSLAKELADRNGAPHDRPRKRA